MDNLFNTSTNEELGDKMNMDELQEEITVGKSSVGGVVAIK